MKNHYHQIKQIFFLTLFLLISLVSCQTAEPEAVLPISGMPQGSEGFAWWNDTVFYEIFVRSFYDSDCDGVGDIQGIIEKLDYLNDGDPNTSSDLGITGIWLMPINPSPSYHGYDVTDYYNINPDYGSMEDFEQLLEEAHARGIRVIIDLVVNHSSSKHPWFVDSMSPGSEYRDWYLWQDELPGINWHSSENGYYYALFWSEMPDFNYQNPEMVAEMNAIANFWVGDVGVDGFRTLLKKMVWWSIHQGHMPGLRSLLPVLRKRTLRL
jgi:glycosidase